MTLKTTTWKLDPHTRAKHELLRRYLGAWFPILTSSGYHGRVVFLDGFAGPGVYDSGEPGSPIVALTALLDHPLFTRLKSEFTFHFVEPKPKRVASLKRELEALSNSRGGWPKNVKVAVHEAEFKDVGEGVLEYLATQKAKLAPTFAFVDPFGFSGVPIELLGRLLAFDRCEVFFTFMVDHVNRFLDEPTVEQHMLDLFGTDEYLGAGQQPPGEPRRRFLHDLYARQLKEVAGFRYVRSFEMTLNNGHVGYYLYYGTRHLLGLKVMKDAMWRVDPGGGIGFSDRLAGQPVLFVPEPNLEPLRDALLARFSGSEVSVEAVEEFVLIHTPYSASQYKKGALKPLEAAGLLEASHPWKNRRAGTYPAGTLVKFA